MNGIVTNAERIARGAERAARTASPTRLAALSTRWRARFGFVEKLKIPCPPGLRPVRNDDQAVGVIAGIVERSGPKAPSSSRRPSVGSLPCGQQLADELVVGAVEAEAEGLHGGRRRAARGRGGRASRRGVAEPSRARRARCARRTSGAASRREEGGARPPRSPACPERERSPRPRRGRPTRRSRPRRRRPSGARRPWPRAATAASSRSWRSRPRRRRPPRAAAGLLRARDGTRRGPRAPFSRRAPRDSDASARCLRRGGAVRAALPPRRGRSAETSCRCSCPGGSCAARGSRARRRASRVDERRFGSARSGAKPSRSTCQKTLRISSASAPSSSEARSSAFELTTKRSAARTACSARDLPGSSRPSTSASLPHGLMTSGRASERAAQ